MARIKSRGKAGQREAVSRPAKRPAVLAPAPRRMGRRLLLDRRLVDEIADAVRRGAFLHVAAEASGVSRRTLFSWLERGRELAGAADDGAELDEREQLFVDLVFAVTMAHAQARLRAEGAVLEENPLAWLRFGPGRDHGPDDPGWTQAVREVPPEVKSAAEQMLSEALRQLGLVPDVGARPREHRPADDVAADICGAARPVAVLSTAQPVLTDGAVGAEDRGEDGGDVDEVDICAAAR